MTNHYDDEKVEKIVDKLEEKLARQRMRERSKNEERAAFQGVFDKFTLESLDKLQRKGAYDEFVGIISAGKEANVYLAYDLHGNPLAIKIYKIDPHNTSWMKNYIIGDPRFYKIGTSTHKIIYTWCKKEFKNLSRMYKAEISVPKPVELLKNILIMEYIGDKNGTPAPKLKDVVGLISPEEELSKTLDMIKNMFIKARLVHGDLSEFNILYYNNKQYIIDVSQAVPVEHPHALLFLRRDIKNILIFFRKILGEGSVPDEEDVFNGIIQESNFF